MNDNRMHVLEMLAAGQVSAEEADRLIGALDKEPAAPVAARQPRYLRIVMAEHGAGATNLNIRVPFQLLRAGVRLASLVPNGAKDKINEALLKNGVPIDVTQLKPEDLDELVIHLADLTIDVEEQDSKIKIFAE